MYHDRARYDPEYPPPNRYPPHNYHPAPPVYGSAYPSSSQNVQDPYYNSASFSATASALAAYEPPSQYTTTHSQHASQYPPYSATSSLAYADTSYSYPQPPLDPVSSGVSFTHEYAHHAPEPAHFSRPINACRVYVGNLSYDTTWQDLKDHMMQAGEAANDTECSYLYKYYLFIFMQAMSFTLMF
jgi:hypothetical protein